MGTYGLKEDDYFESTMVSMQIHNHCTSMIIMIMIIIQNEDSGSSPVSNG